MTDCNGCPRAQHGPEGWCFARFAVDLCPQSADHRYFNRHEPTFRQWTVEGLTSTTAENHRMNMEPIEDEDVYHPSEPLVRPPTWFGAVGSSTFEPVVRPIEDEL
jgi:hypothetical protein